MVKRRPWVLLALLAAGCPDELGRGSSSTVEVGLLAPTELRVEYDGGSRIVLRWSDHSTSESGYRLEMSATPFESPTIADVRQLPADSASIVYPTVPNSTYYFRVFATTASMESDPSNVCVAITPNVPAQPGGVDARPHTSSEIALSWTDVSGETSYVVERSVDGGASWFGADTAAPNTTSFVVGGMAPDSEVAHRIVAMNAFGRSTPSDPAIAQTTTASMTFVTLPLVGNYGEYTSCAVGPDGREHIACYDVVSSSVLYATRLFPGAFTMATADGGPSGFEDVGGDGTGLAVDRDGKAHVVAHDRTNDSFRYATDMTGTWKGVTLAYGCGIQPRIGCGRSAGLLHATCLETFGTVNGNLIRYFEGSPGQSWAAFSGNVRSIPTARHALAVRYTGTPLVAAIDPMNRIQTYFGRPESVTTMGWLPHTAVPLPVYSPVVGDTDFAEDARARHHVVFHERSSRSLYHGQDGSVAAEIEAIDSDPRIDVGAFCALVLELSTGRLHVAYYDATRKDLRYARKDPGGAWVRRVIEAAGDVGSHASIGVDGAGRVTIAYRDETNRRLRVAVGRP
ncbi:MAG TPA: fibronectin type III domain-containing protein [Planctomycetota bacterium]|jgi:hypothetical protein|nr:fibronectin type III domain-containing protein [Planctomycetota bacterium]